MTDRKMRNSTAAAFCGLLEKKQDACDVHYILHAISVNCALMGGVRLGKEKTLGVGDSWVPAARGDSGVLKLKT